MFMLYNSEFQTSSFHQEFISMLKFVFKSVCSPNMFPLKYCCKIIDKN